VKAKDRPVYRGKEDRRRRREGDQLVSAPAVSEGEAPPSSPPPVKATASTAPAGEKPQRRAAPEPPQAPEPAPTGEDSSEPPSAPPGDGEPPEHEPPDPPDDGPPSQLTAADVVDELRYLLRAAEHEEAALKEERESLRAELLALAQDVRSKALGSDAAKAMTGALRAALADVNASAAQASARARELRDRLQRHEGLELVRIAPGVNPHTATLDAVLRGEAPATTGERLIAARISSLSEVVKTDDDPAAALLTWTGEVWGAP
jgi:hypothetical protein